MLDGEPGQELQLDTGWVGRLTLPERKWRRFRAWIFTAVRSRHRFVYPTFEETTANSPNPLTHGFCAMTAYDIAIPNSRG